MAAREKHVVFIQVTRWNIGSVSAGLRMGAGNHRITTGRKCTHRKASSTGCRPTEQGTSAGGLYVIFGFLFIHKNLLTGLMKPWLLHDLVGFKSVVFTARLWGITVGPLSARTAPRFSRWIRRLIITGHLYSSWQST